MSEKIITESVDFECLEEKRTAHLLLEWTVTDGVRRLTGVQCDNPRFADLEPWQCSWTCWRRIEETLGS